MTLPLAEAYDFSAVSTVALAYGCLGLHGKRYCGSIPEARV
jgi:hypothetical protein